MSDAPSSAVDICNLALDFLGEGALVQDIDDPVSDNELLFARWYDQTRRKLLRSYNWNFACKFTTLARVGDGNGGYEDAYEYPADLLKVLMLSADTITQYLRPDQALTEYEITTEAGVRTLNIDNGAGTLYLKYTRDITDISVMDPLFVEVLALELAYAIAFRVTGKKSEVERVSQMLTLALPKAISADGQERPPRRISQSKAADARQALPMIGTNAVPGWVIP